MDPNPGFRSVARVRSAFANAAFYRALSKIVTAVIYILLVRIMSEYDYGVYQLFYSVPVAMSVVLSLGLGNALHRFLPEYFSREQWGLARHFVSWALRLRLATSILFLTVCLLFWEPIGTFFKIAEAKTEFLIFAVVIITHFQCRIFTLALSANLMQQWSSGLSTAFALVKLIGYIVAIAIGVSLETIIVADLIGYVLWYIALRIAFQTRIPNVEDGKKVRFEKDEKRRVTRYAAYFNFNDVGVVALRTTSDNLFIAAFLDPIAVGAYAFCTGFSLLIHRLTPVAFFNGVIEPLLFTFNYGTQKRQVTQYFQFLVKVNYLAQFPILIAVAAVPEPIINVIFGGKFVEYSGLLIAAFALPTLYAFQQPSNIIAQLGERAAIILVSKIFAVYNIVAAIILIPILGVYGAILATGTARLFKAIFIWFFVRDVARFGGLGRFFVLQASIWAACLILIKILVSNMNDFMAIAVAGVIIGLFTLLGVRLAMFNTRESELIQKLSGNRISRWLQYAGVIRA
jgi:O-antigen/teichoic acid export membrane protein